MYYYCKNSRKKIIHLSSCHHISNSDISAIASFNNIAEAEKKGYRVCKHCAGLKSYLREEKKQIQKICKDNGISVNNSWAFLHVNTVYGQWKIIFDEERNCLQLFHKNAFETGKPSLIPHYHFQNYDCDTIAGYLDYIIKHDDFRHANPLRIKQGKPKKPQKGTRAWDNLQKKNKYKQKKQAVYNVLHLINSLQLQQQACC